MKVKIKTTNNELSSKIMNLLKKFKNFINSLELSEEFLLAIITINLALTFIIPLYFSTTFKPVIEIEKDNILEITKFRNEMRDIALYLFIITCFSFILIPFVNIINKRWIVKLAIIITLIIITCFLVYNCWQFIYELSRLTFHVSNSTTSKVSESAGATIYVNTTEIGKRIDEYCNRLKLNESITIPPNETYVFCTKNNTFLPITIIKNESGCHLIFPTC